MYNYTCRFCNEELLFENHNQIGGHVTNCRKNPNYGKSFEKFGFKEIELIEPITFYVDPKSYKRYSAKELNRFNFQATNFIEVKNSGSKKLILDLRNQ